MECYCVVGSVLFGLIYGVMSQCGICRSSFLLLLSWFLMFFVTNFSYFKLNLEVITSVYYLWSIERDLNALPEVPD